MKFKFKASTLHRLSNNCSFFEPTVDKEMRDKLNVIRLEHRNGFSYVISTNSKIASIEWIGTTDEPDGVANITLTPELLRVATQESLLGFEFTLDVIKELGIGVLKSLSGYVYQGNPCKWFNETPMDKWVGWFDHEAPHVSKGYIYMDLFHIQNLMATSPSGKIVFPAVINNEHPLILRDIVDPSWVGVFVPKHTSDFHSEAAKLPDWFPHTRSE